MISYLEGRIREVRTDRITLLVNGIGYEVLVPAYLMAEMRYAYQENGELGLFICYLQTEKQPKPTLVGFRNSVDKEFFEYFISVEDIGPMAAVKALARPLSEIARAIEERDLKALKELRGIGERKAAKIVAALNGKVAKYALACDRAKPLAAPLDLKKDVEDVMINQLGHKPIEARKMIEDALKRNPEISSSEELFEEVYRGQRK